MAVNQLSQVAGGGGRSGRGQCLAPKCPISDPNAPFIIQTDASDVAFGIGGRSSLWGFCEKEIKA